VFTNVMKQDRNVLEMEKMTRIICRGIGIFYGSASVISFLRHNALCDSQIPPATKKTFSCENPTCKSKSELFFSEFKRVNLEKNSTSTVLNSGYYAGCPVDKDELGRNTWSLIHTIAANYPENPNYQEMANVINFFSSLALVYPCPECAFDFQENLLISPPE